MGANVAWAFLTRAGSEVDLIDELPDKVSPRQIGEGVVLAEGRPRLPNGSFAELAFARQAMNADAEADADPDSLVQAAVGAMRAHRPKKKSAEPWTWAFQLVAPDSSDPHDPRKKLVRALEEGDIEARLVDAVGPELAERRVAVDAADRLVMAWPVDDETLLVGVTPALQALSRAPGGKVRLRRAEDAPSRAGSKLEEAIAWIGVGPERGDQVADLGAAPGGWSKVALDLGASVVAVDPANMKIQKKKLKHEKMSAFEYVPDDTLDWVLCDMAWRPMEVAKLIAKWGRRGWARQLFVNFKLPMKQKHAVLRDILRTLKNAGWEGLRARQLYHDRDEVTVFGWLNAGIVARGAVPAFEMKSRKNKPRGRGRNKPRGRGRNKPRGRAKPRRRR